MCFLFLESLFSFCFLFFVLVFFSFFLTKAKMIVFQANKYFVFNKSRARFSFFSCQIVRDLYEMRNASVISPLREKSRFFSSKKSIQIREVENEEEQEEMGPKSYHPYTKKTYNNCNREFHLLCFI